MIKNPILKNVLTALLVAVLGYVALGLTFILDALYQSVIRAIVQPFVSSNLEMTYNWWPLLMTGTFFIIMGIISWFVLKTILATFWKAVFMTVPIGLVLMAIGMNLYRWPIAVYSLGTLFTGGLLFYFIYKKKPWLYSFSLLFVSLSLLIMMLTGAEI